MSTSVFKEVQLILSSTNFFAKVLSLFFQGCPCGLQNTLRTVYFGVFEYFKIAKYDFRSIFIPAYFGKVNLNICEFSETTTFDAILIDRKKANSRHKPLLDKK